jgi:hypothetical protein
MKVEYIKGEDNIPADFFSRLISKDISSSIDHLNVIYNEEEEINISKYYGPTPGHFGINKTVSLNNKEVLTILD